MKINYSQNSGQNTKTIITLHWLKKIKIYRNPIIITIQKIFTTSDGIVVISSYKYSKLTNLFLFSSTYIDISNDVHLIK